MRFLESALLRRVLRRQTAVELGPRTKFVVFSPLLSEAHLLAHREGIVDQEYLDRTRDTTYRVGQKLVIKNWAVTRLADLVERLASHL